VSPSTLASVTGRQLILRLAMGVAEPRMPTITAVIERLLEPRAEGLPGLTASAWAMRLRVPRLSVVRFSDLDGCAKAPYSDARAGNRGTARNPR